MPDFAEASPAGSRASVPGLDVGAAAASRSGRLNLKVLLGLVGVALAVRFAVYGISYATSMNLSIPNAEDWQDFVLAYLPAVQAFKNGLVPYLGFYYPYPPLFLWTLAAFSPFPYPSWLTALPLVLGDALTVIPVYLIARELSSERVSRLVSLIFVFAPTNLYYVDYLFLNPSLTTLFLMTSLYFMIRGRYGWSAISLALSIGFKQTALFALPAILLVVWKKAGRRVEPLRYLLVVVAICLAFSVPYLAVSPAVYIDSLLRLPLNMPAGYYLVGGGTQVTFDTSNWLTSRWLVLAEGVYSPVTLILPLFLFVMPSSLLDVYNSPLLTQAGWFFLLVGYALTILWLRWKTRIDPQASLRYVLGAILFVFALYPLFKYYVVGIVPLLILLVRTKKDALGFGAFTLALFLIPRYFASWVLLASFAWIYKSDVKQFLSLGVRSLVAPLRSTRKESGGRAPDDDDARPSLLGHALSLRAFFVVVAAGWFALLLALIPPHLGFASAFFFATGLISAVYLAKSGPKGLVPNHQNVLWFGMLWGYDLPFLVLSSLLFFGLIRL